ncbi:hypothetical protein KCP77_08030 [Salmonella enterica subsp. enterica]|nr:hypothetical protein KCP77_08030 [Salmonella enterica subsp. enterica]
MAPLQNTGHLSAVDGHTNQMTARFGIAYQALKLLNSVIPPDHCTPISRRNVPGVFAGLLLLIDADPGSRTAPPRAARRGLSPVLMDISVTQRGA